MYDVHSWFFLRLFSSSTNFAFFCSMKSKTNHSYRCTHKPQVSVTFKVYFSVNVIQYYARYDAIWERMFLRFLEISAAYPTRRFYNKINVHSDVKLFIESMYRVTCLLLVASHSASGFTLLRFNYPAFFFIHAVIFTCCRCSLSISDDSRNQSCVREGKEKRSKIINE